MGQLRSVLLQFSRHPKQICSIIILFAIGWMIIQTQPRKFLRTTNIDSIIPQLRRQSSDYFDLSAFDRRENGKWFNFTTNDFRFFAYSAIYDDRPSLMSPPVLRIVAITDDYDEFKARNATPLYCVLHYDTDKIVVEMKEDPKPIGYPGKLNKSKARKYLYSCPTIDGMAPIFVSITAYQMQQVSSAVPVVLPEKPTMKRDFCACVHTIFGTKLDPYRLIEWLEMQKILGVSLVGVYIMTAPEPVLKVLRHYSDENFVEIRKSDFIYSDNLADEEFELHSTSVIDDCMYRHMYEFKRMLVLDYDEIIMPRKHLNLADLVSYLDEKTLERKKPSVNFAFRNNYFFLDIPSDETFSSKYLTFLQFRKKVPVSPDGFWIKSIINPQACVNMHNHYCWSVTKNYSSLTVTESVDPEIGLNQHYKKCHFSRQECEKMKRNVTQDDTMLRFSDLLSRNVKEKVTKIMGNYDEQ